MYLFSTSTLLSDLFDTILSYSSAYCNIPESVKLKMSNKAERLINTALLAKLSVLKFAPNGCRKNI